MQIDGIIDDAVDKALAAQKEALMAESAAALRKEAARSARLVQSRSFWRSCAFVCTAALAAGICTEVLLYRRD